MSAPVELPQKPFDGGKTLMTASGVAGLVGTVLWFVLGRGEPERAAYSWLWAFFYWLTPAFGCIGWLSSFHAAKAKWPILPRRLLELLGATVPVFAVLFIPILFSMKTLYPWTHPETLPEEARRLVEHRHVWLNSGFFVVRVIVYFAIFIAVSELHLRWSLGQDRGENQLNTAKSWRLGPGSLPFLGFAFGFAAFDWLMSLSVTYYSSMFGLNVIAGAVMAGMACWILATDATRTPISLHHRHSMGKLLFAFVCFWAYTGFSQFMLIWIADIPEETPWFRLRLESGWEKVGWILVIFHFVVPFIVLLSKRLKFSPQKLGVMAVYLLLVHAIDLYWIVMPEVNKSGPSPALTDLLAFVGVGGVALAFFLFRLRGKLLVPVGDPFLPASLEYHP